MDMKGHFVFLKIVMPKWKYILARLYYCLVFTIVMSRHLNENWARKSLRNIFMRVKLRANANCVSLS